MRKIAISSTLISRVLPSPRAPLGIKNLQPFIKLENLRNYCSLRVDPRLTYDHDGRGLTSLHNNIFLVEKGSKVLFFPEQSGARGATRRSVSISINAEAWALERSDKIPSGGGCGGGDDDGDSNGDDGDCGGGNGAGGGGGTCLCASYSSSFFFTFLFPFLPVLCTAIFRVVYGYLP